MLFESLNSGVEIKLSCILELNSKTSSKGIFSRLSSAIALKRRFSSIGRILGGQTARKRAKWIIRSKENFEGMDSEGFFDCFGLRPRNDSHCEPFDFAQDRLREAISSLGKMRKDIFRVFSEDGGVKFLPPRKSR